MTSLLFPPYFFAPIGFLIFPFICFYFDNFYKHENKFKNFIYMCVFNFSFFISFLFWLQNPFLQFDETKNLFFLPIFFIIFLSLTFSSIFTLIIYLNKNIPIYFIIPIIFTINEYIVSILFYGFPWMNFSLILSSNEHFSFLYRFCGTLISSYLIIQVFCTPYIFLKKNSKKHSYKYSFIIFIFPIILIIIIYLSKINNKSDEKIIDLEIFQLNNKTYLNHINSEQKMKNIIEYISQSNSDLIIFAENNYPFLIENIKENNIQHVLKENQTVIIGGTRIENNSFYNTVLSINSNSISHFDKKILVPFGEFLPLRNFLKPLSIISGSNDYTSGNQERLIMLNSTISFIPIICYEIIFYWKIINNKNFNSNFIINITNDIWFGKYLGPYQHFYLTKLRAAELNKPIIRVSNNGISGLIDQNGKILLKTSLNSKTNIKKILKIYNYNNYYFLHSILKFYFLFILILLVFFNLKKTND